MSKHTNAQNRHIFNDQTCRDPKAKQDTRDRTLRNVMAMAQWHPDGYLTEDWIDLCGDTPRDEILKMLLVRNALRPGKGRYLGVNNDPAIIKANRSHFAKEITASLCDFRCCEWNDAIQSEWAAKATVITFDGFASVARTALPDTLGPTITHAKDRVKRYGQAMLYLNMSRPYQADMTAYKAYLLDALGIDMPESQIHEYTSKVWPMVSIWFRMGF